MVACIDGHIDVCDLLLSRGANCNDRNKNVNNCIYDDIPLIYMSVNGFFNAFLSLYKIGNTALMVASRWGRINVCDFLINRGANVNISDYVWTRSLLLSSVIIPKYVITMVLLTE
jgi:ankyrin repeat protein